MATLAKVSPFFCSISSGTIALCQNFAIFVADYGVTAALLLWLVKGNPV